MKRARVGVWLPRPYRYKNRVHCKSAQEWVLFRQASVSIL